MTDRGAPLFPETPRRHRIHGGLNERQEHIFTWISVVVVLLFMTAWVGAIAEIRRQRIAETPIAGAPAETPLAPPPPAQQITSALLDPDAPTGAYINDAMLGFLNPLRGKSGKVHFAPALPGESVVSAPGAADAVLSRGTSSEVSPDFAAPEDPGVYKLAVQFGNATRTIDAISVVTLVPSSEKRGGRIGLYYLGNWPFELGGKPRGEAYTPPSGFIEVTPQNQNLKVSDHFRLRDFLTKDQPNVWPKYLLLSPKLLDKLELTIEELERRGIRVTYVQVMSGFRTPRYNHSGGDTTGRANLSRHMYGDASDIFVDNDRNGMMDDINRDGRVDTRDAQVIADAADRAERRYPSLAGGIGVYSACCGHGPFAHIDVRGFRARWRGSGNG